MKDKAQYLPCSQHSRLRIVSLTLLFLMVLYAPGFSQITMSTFIENFDNTTFPPTGWLNEQVSGTGLFDRVTSGSWPTCSPKSGVAMVRFASFNYSSSTAALITPPLYLLSTATYRVKFWMYHDPGYPTSLDRISVNSNTTASLTGAIELGVINRYSATTGWVEHSYTLPADPLKGVRYVILKAISAYGNNIFLDSLTVEEIAAAPVLSIDPLTKAFGELQIGTTSTSQTFTITNTGGGTLTISGIAKAGTDPAQFTLTDGNSYPVNLTAGQSTTVQVAFSPTTAGAKTADIAVTQSVTDRVTNIPVTGTGVDFTISAFPYVQNFDNPVFPPTGWLNQQITGTGLFKRVLTGTSPIVVPKSDSAMVQYNCYNYSAGTSAVLISPPLSLGAGDYQVKFWMYRDAGYVASLDRISIFVNNSPSLTGADSLGNIFRNKTLAPAATDTGWFEYTFTIPNPADDGIPRKYVILKGVSAFGNNIYLDSLTIQAAPLFAVNWANLQWPVTAIIIQGGTASVYAQAWIADSTQLPGPTAGLSCWIGVNADNTNPNTWTTWVPATFNTQSGNNDEFTANIGATLPIGTYYYAARWQYLGGPYRYGGYNAGGGGFWDGTANVSGVLTVNPYIATLPIVEGFEGATFPPSAWTLVNTVPASPTWVSSTAAPHTGLKQARYSYSSTYDANDWLITPAFTLQYGKTYKLTYWYKSANALYPEKLLVAFGNKPNPDSLTIVLADHPNITNTAYMSNTLYFTLGPTETPATYFYVGFKAYSVADQWNLDLDDIEISEVPNNDYAVISLTQQNPIPGPLKVTVLNYKKDESELSIKLDGLTGVKQTDVNNSGTVKFGNPAEIIEGIRPVILNALIQNQGILSTPFDFNYKFNGVAGTVVNRPGVSFLETDTLIITPTVTARGTFTTQAYVNSAADTLKGNDTLTNNKTLVYPDPMSMLQYDNGSNTVPTFVGFGTNNLPLTAAVRFTSGSEMRVASIDALYRNELVGDSITVTVYAAGLDTTAPGTVLYTKKFGGVNYINSGNAGDYVTLPLGNDAPVFLEGMDFWVGITFSTAIQFPMGAHDAGFTPGRSYLTDGSGTWFPLVITTERAWLLRTVGVPYVPAMYNTIWQRSSANGNLPGWFGTSADHTERGLAYGNTLPGIEGNDRVYVVSRKGGLSVKILDASNGNDLGNLSTVGIAGGTYVLNDVDVTDDGKILAGNLTLNASTDTFRVYMWNNESGLAVPVIKYLGTDAVRLGDKITVIGNYSLGTAVLYAGSATVGQMKVYKFTMSGGVFNSVPTVIALSDNAAGTPTSASIAPLPNGDFYWKATGFSVKKYTGAGVLLGTIPGTVVATGANAIRYIGTLVDQEYIIVFQYGAGNNNARIVKVPVSDVSLATTYDITPTLGSVANGNGAGDVAYKVNHDGSIDIFVLATNNGVGLYRTIQPVPVELTSFTATSQDNNVYISWSTATEINSSVFQIERKSGSNWGVVGSVEAAGTSTEMRSYSFTDKSVTSEKLSYRLKMVDNDGSYSYSKEVNVEMGVPGTFRVSQNYPNPFNPSTRIDYQLPSDANVTVELYDVTGQKVATMINQDMSAGYHSFDLEAGRYGMATGVYIYRIVAIDKASGQTFVDSKKLMILK